ncbi:GTP-binding protein [Herbivorax sp. ANBcel31]|uniref:GTP-binding protein n=1 Tax=Herbivorax sp. ANBcel31 TaxID=3069754 RepID=UPI0027B10DBA|nr:GTP-binding protein [Herbivorax sp. ANBcel31]MDQ2085453.1 GTP-binding protein [Herbivorax sp. ANBcel31]
MDTNKEVLKIVVVGHVDHGKSTVIGRLLYDTKSLPEGAVEKVKRISKETGKPFEYAYLLDAFEEEQKQGITIDTTQLQFHTQKRDYIIIDAPGHKEFLKNMISGAASAEAALLIIDANEGIQEQSKRHGYILSLLGIKNVYVIVNKMDLIDYSENKFNQIQEEMDEFLNNLNVFPLKYIPVSAFNGENITKTSEKMPWNAGEPVLEALDLFEKGNVIKDKPLRFPIQDVYKFDNRRIIAGRIESGKLKVGDEILISPGHKSTKVKSIEGWSVKEPLKEVTAGESIGITVEDEFFNKRGEVISHKEEAPLVSNLLEVNVFWMGKKPLVKNKKYKVKLVTQEVEGEIYSINKVIDATTLKTMENVEEVNTNDVAEITLKLKEKVAFDSFSSNQNTGRFVIVDGYDVWGGGIISGVKTKEKHNISIFIKDGTEVSVKSFDQYYFVIKEGIIKPVSTSTGVYNLGDSLPVKGETYSFPEDFNILDLHLGKIIKVRNAKFYDMLDIEQYSYDEIPLINSLGAGINILSDSDILKFRQDYRELEKTDFANKWFDLLKYRKVKYK